ncbi:MAG TPA: cell division protein FtsQ/DivIB [Pseudolabrys sp.]|nr:cell division protein FtsQ/DivIB [Pseudolabrys sp.]
MASLAALGIEGRGDEEPVAMGGRGFLARVLKGQTERHAFAAPPPSPSFAVPSVIARWQRTVRRWGVMLDDIELPRGLGASGVALLLLASVSYGVVRGGHQQELSANVQDLCDGVANVLGFRISEVALSGEHALGRAQVLAIAGITDRSSLLFLDAGAVRARLMANPWIASATVLKLYPSRLTIQIKERQPFALWQKDGQVSVIAHDGTVLDTQVPASLTALPLLVGKGAERQGAEMLALVARYPVIARQVEALVLVAERRWNLHLKTGVEVLLPESEPEQALRQLVDLDRAKKLLSRDIVAVDLRLSDRVTVRQSDAAFAARDAALKAAEKAAKQKKKGGEA